MAGAAHKPGAVPLRPLGLSDIYDATFKIIRFNPKATVGAAVLVASVAMALPVLVTGILSALLTFSFDPEATSAGAEDLAGLLGSLGSLLLGSVLLWVGLILVTGMIAHVVMAAALGKRLTLGQAWAATRGSRLRLIGLTLLLSLLSLLLLTAYVASWFAVVLSSEWPVWVLYGVLSIPLAVALTLLFWIRVYYLPVPALMLENLGVLAALGRGFALTRGAYWRTLGIALLTYLIAQIGGTMLAMPFSLIGEFAPFATGDGEAAVVLLVVFTAVGTVVSAAFVAPFTTCVTVLQYLDLRIRQEALDVHLMEFAQRSPRGPGAP